MAVLNAMAGATGHSVPPWQAMASEMGQSYYYRNGSTVSMDMDAPYCLYVNGQRVAEYQDEATANEEFLRLRTQMRQASARDKL